MPRIQIASKTNGIVHIKRSPQICIEETKPSEQFERSRHTSLPSLLVSTRLSPETDGISFYRRLNSLSIYFANQHSILKFLHGNISTVRTTSMPLQWALQDAKSLHMLKDQHACHGTTEATLASTSDLLSTTTDVTLSSNLQHQQSSFLTPSSFNIQLSQYLH